jgi:hypothetical protein
VGVGRELRSGELFNKELAKETKEARRLAIAAEGSLRKTKTTEAEEGETGRVRLRSLPVTTRRKSTSEDYGNDIHFFSLARSFSPRLLELPLFTFYLFPSARCGVYARSSRAPFLRGRAARRDGGGGDGAGAAAVER